MITVMITPKIMKWAMTKATQGIREPFMGESKAATTFRVLSHLGEAAFWSSYQDSFRSNSLNYDIVVKSRLKKMNQENQKIVLGKKDLQESDADFIVIALVSESLKSVTLVGYESPEAIIQKSMAVSHELKNPWNERVIIETSSLLPIESMSRFYQRALTS